MTIRPRLVVATRNPGKAREIAAALPEVQVCALESYPDLKMPDEVGETFLENARIKASYVADALGAAAVLADDSGLEVEYLGGRPGVRSARWREGTDADRSDAILRALDGVEPVRRGARFVCAMIFCGFGSPVGVEGVCEGRISTEPRGDRGFGYDPIFELPDGRTMAELHPEEKNRISHRGKALSKILPLLRQHFGWARD
ncbi:MAG: RdgB/HAM1 family non-canonical purine NTP pyrophosphatase [Myxococcota bacterium]